MAEKLWDLANVVAGFAIVQALATTYAITKGDIVPLRDDDAHRAALVLMAVFLAMYLTAILWCSWRGRELDADNARLWNKASLGRVVGVVAFQLVAVAVVVGHWKRPADYATKIEKPAAEAKPAIGASSAAKP